MISIIVVELYNFKDFPLILVHFRSFLVLQKQLTVQSSESNRHL